MPTPRLSYEKMREAVEAYEKHGRNKARAARQLGLNRKTFHSRLTGAWERGIEGGSKPEADFETPSFPDDDIPAEDILDHLERRFQKKWQYAKTFHWMPVYVQRTEPIGIAWIGDPHLGDNGCNLPLLRRDVNLVASTPGLYGVNIGDTVNNWSGRLIGLYAHQDTSKETERKLAQWFLQKSGIKWLVWIFGNHDEMDPSFLRFLESQNAGRAVMKNWRAQFQIVFPNGFTYSVDAAHDHKGHSQWNELHGQERASYFEEPADIYVSGHRHNWALKKKEMPDGRVITLARVRGYKFLDEYAFKRQLFEHQFGASLVTVIDPEESNPVKQAKTFEDVEQGAEYLKWLREGRC